MAEKIPEDIPPLIVPRLRLRRGDNGEVYLRNASRDDGSFEFLFQRDVVGCVGWVTMLVTVSQRRNDIRTRTHYVSAGHNQHGKELVYVTSDMGLKRGLGQAVILGSEMGGTVDELEGYYMEDYPGYDVNRLLDVHGRRTGELIDPHNPVRAADMYQTLGQWAFPLEAWSSEEVMV